MRYQEKSVFHTWQAPSSRNRRQPHGLVLHIGLTSLHLSPLQQNCPRTITINLLTFRARFGCCAAELQETCWTVNSEILIQRIFTYCTIVISFRVTQFSTELMESCSLIPRVAHSLSRKDCATSRKTVHGIRVLCNEQNECLHTGGNSTKRA